MLRILINLSPQYASVGLSGCWRKVSHEVHGTLSAQLYFPWWYHRPHTLASTGRVRINYSGPKLGHRIRCSLQGRRGYVTPCRPCGVQRDSQPSNRLSILKLPHKMMQKYLSSPCSSVGLVYITSESGMLKSINLFSAIVILLLLLVS